MQTNGESGSLEEREGQTALSPLRLGSISARRFGQSSHHVLTHVCTLR